MTNRMRLEFESRSVNEGFARIAVAAFVACLNPTVEELSDIKTAVSEAVTNAIIHGYGHEQGVIAIETEIIEKEVMISIIDEGCGIENVKKAMEPLYTTRPDLERSGMGFAFMQAFTDELSVESGLCAGTRVHMKKRIGAEEYEYVKRKD